MKKGRIKRSIMSLGLAMVMCVSSGLPAHAVDMESYQYMAPDGTVYNYYLDETLNPYIIRDGEPIYIALPLAHLEVTDTQKLAELNAARNSARTRDIPTDFYDISTGGDKVTVSPTYSANVDFDTTSCFATPVLKLNRYHATLRIKTADVIKENLVGGSEINLRLYYYEGTEDRWYAHYYIGTTCTGLTGYGLVYPTSVTEYVKFEVTEYSPIKTLTLKVWTTAYS